MTKPANPLSLVKKIIMDASRRIYNIRGVTAKQDHIEELYTDVVVGRAGGDLVLSPAIQKALWCYFIDDLVANRFEQRRELDIAEPDLFEDFEYKFSIPSETGKGRVLIALGDIGLPEMQVITKLKDANIEAATAERERWGEACALVEPLLRKYPDWKWADAVRFLKESGAV
jgi:hypothetical protein